MTVAVREVVATFSSVDAKGWVRSTLFLKLLFIFFQDFQEFISQIFDSMISKARNIVYWFNSLPSREVTQDLFHSIRLTPNLVLNCLGLAIIPNIIPQLELCVWSFYRNSKINSKIFQFNCINGCGFKTSLSLDSKSRTFCTPCSLTFPVANN